MAKTTVLFDVTAGNSVPVDPSSVTIEPVVRFAYGDGITLAEGVTHQLIGGRAQIGIEARQLYRVTLSIRGEEDSAVYYVPESPDAIRFRDLVQVTWRGNPDGVIIPTWATQVHEDREAVSLTASEVEADRLSAESASAAAESARQGVQALIDSLEGVSPEQLNARITERIAEIDLGEVTEVMVDERIAAQRGLTIASLSNGKIPVSQIPSVRVMMAAFAPEGQEIGAGNAAADTTALKAAIADAFARKMHVEIPAGSFLLNEEIVIPNSGSTFSPFLVGAGKKATTLRWNDLGPGKYAIRKASITQGVPWGMLGMTIRSTANNRTLGVSPVQMDGIEGARRIYMHDCRVEFFNSGIILRGDHVKFEDTEFSNNYYGVGFRNNNTQGDVSFIDCDLGGNAMASFGIMAGGKFDAVSMYRGHIGYSPYGIFAEAGAFAAGAIATDFKSFGTSWEAFGNGAIFEDGGASSNGWTGFYIESSGNFSSFADQQLSSRPSTALFAVPVANGWVLSNLYTAGGGVIAALFAGLWNNCQFYGDVLRFVRPYVTAGKKIMASGLSPFGSVSNGRGFMFSGGGLSGIICRATAAVAAGQVVEYNGTDSARANTANGFALGISHYDAAVDEGMLVVQSGAVVPAQFSATTTANERVVIDPANPSKLVGLSSAPSARIVGCVRAGAGSPTGTSNVVLRMY